MLNKQAELTRLESAKQTVEAVDTIHMLQYPLHLNGSNTESIALVALAKNTTETSLIEQTARVSDAEPTHDFSLSTPIQQTTVTHQINETA